MLNINANDAVLIGTAIATALGVLFGHRLRKPQAHSEPSPNIAIVGGAMADTLGLQQNTDAILKLAASHDARSVVDQINGDSYRKQNELFDSAIDELILIRRALEEIAERSKRRR